MSLAKDILRVDFIENQNFLDKIITEWNCKYQDNLDKLSSKFGVKCRLLSTSDSDSEKDYSFNNNDEIVCNLIKQALQCKAYAEVEYQSIRDIRSELEDCQMIKELGMSIRKLEEEKSEQNMMLKNLNNKNFELLQEKEKLEKSLHELTIQCKAANNQSTELVKQSPKKSALTAKLESLTNRTQIPKKLNKNTEYCHIAPIMSLFSDSELSISEEDSLEKDKNHNTNTKSINQNTQSNGGCINSPKTFIAGIGSVSKSTPVKGSNKINDVLNYSWNYNAAISNLTQDLKEIQKYFDKSEEMVFSPSHVLDWEMSQISVDENKDKKSNGYVLEGKEDPDDDQLPDCPNTCCESCCKDEQMIKYASTLTSNIIHSSQNYIHKVDCDLLKLQNDLVIEKEKFDSLSTLVADVYALIHKPVPLSPKDVPTCSGDQPLRHMPIDPLEQLRKIKITIDNNYAKDKVINNSEKSEKSDNEKEKISYPHQNNLIITENTSEFCSDEVNTNIFKMLSETSVRLLTEIVSSINKTNSLISEDHSDSLKNGTKDYTPLVTEYLQYLMSLDCVDFTSESCRQHPIYDLLNQLQGNVQRLSEKQVVNDQDDNGISRSLENFYQDQLNKCYDDISRLKQQLESAQQILKSKLPLDAAQALFEAKQQLQTELECVDREYSRQMAREKKRLEEFENSYNELLANHENMQKKYSEEINTLNQQIEQLERKIEADRRFIDQQQFEWELERTQHNAAIENLNKSLGRIKKPFSSNDNLRDCIESPGKTKIPKPTLNKSKHRSISLESTEASYVDHGSQTVFEEIIILKSHILITDLEKYDEFVELREEIQNNQTVLFNFIHLLSDFIFEITETNHFPISLEILQDFNMKNLSDIFKITELQWDEMRDEVINVRDFLNNFIEEKIKLKESYENLQEELESSLINLNLKQDMIKALEEEIQSLVDFQRNLSKDYDLLQSMIEEKQTELDKMSGKLLTQKTSEDYEETIRGLEKDLSEKKNIIDEREEDLYVLKEEKELLEQKLQSIKEKYDGMLDQHNDIYKDLEKEMKDLQKTNSELLERIDSYSMRESELNNEIENLKKSQEATANQISELNHTIDILSAENKITALRLSEIDEEYKCEIKKQNQSLEEMEALHRRLVEESKKHKVILNTSSCQTEFIANDNSSNDSLMSFVNIQDKLVKTIEKLKKDYIQEKELRHQIEAKYKQFASQYETLSNKVLLLGNRVNLSKLSTNQDNNVANLSLESVDINDLLNESQLSLDEDMEFHKILQDCSNVEPNRESCRAIAVQTDCRDKTPELFDNITTYTTDIGYTNLSDWLPDLLKEVELVLQSCVIGDEIPRDILPKMNRFRDLLEQMYKRQLSILLNKISCIEHEMQLQRKTNQELKYKSDFIMTELQEKDSTQKNLRMRLDQELAGNSRLSESNRNLTEQIRLMKSDLNSQLSQLRDELERERNKYSDVNRQLKNEQHSRETLEAALLVAEERLKLVEYSNTDLIKKSRQQADYLQKEKDSFNTEYAEIFRRCNNYKIQIESLQQNLQYHVMENEKTKNELQETIQSNTEYRDKMNEFVKIYQERRKKLETEINELHQLLQISCRREITFVKENETLRIKCQSIKNVCKDYERKIKELETFVSDLHLKHEDDRQDWLNMINGTIDDKDKDEEILSQVNWLLRMLQLRIELLALHFNPNACTSSGDNRSDNLSDIQTKSIFKNRPYSADSSLNRNNSELMVLLQSIKSMQSMINLYFNQNRNQIPQNFTRLSTADMKSPFSGKSEKHSLNQNSISNRPKPTGSSDSLDSITDTDSVSEPQERSICHQDVDSLSAKIYVIQTNKIVELQSNLSICEKWRRQLIEQKEYIISQLSPKLYSHIVTSLLSEQQQVIVQRNIYRFKFKVVIVAVLAYVKFFRTTQSTNLNVSLSSRLNKVGSQLQQPRFSTILTSSSLPISNSNKLPTGFQKNKIPDNNYFSTPVNYSYNRTPTQSSQRSKTDIIGKYSMEPLILQSKNNNMKMSSSETPNESLDSGIENRIQTSHNRYNLTPTSSVSPILERHSGRLSFTNNSTIPRLIHKSTGSGALSISNSSINSFRRSLPLSTTRDSLTNSLERNSSDKSTNFSNTLRQIDDFGKRLDKYTDISNCI